MEKYGIEILLLKKIEGNSFKGLKWNKNFVHPKLIDYENGWKFRNFGSCSKVIDILCVEVDPYNIFK